MKDALEAGGAPHDLARAKTRVKPQLIERAWLHWTVFSFSALLPAGLIAWLMQPDLSTVRQDYGIPTAVNLMLLAVMIGIAYVIVEGFDPGSLWPLPFRTFTGYLLKMMACLHGVMAIYLVCQKQAASAMLTDVPDFLVWIAFGYCWLIVPLAFLVGDVQLRKRAA